MFHNIFKTLLFLSVCVIGMVEVRADLKKCCAYCVKEHETCFLRCDFEFKENTKDLEYCEDDCTMDFLACSDVCHEDFGEGCSSSAPLSKTEGK